MMDEEEEKIVFNVPMCICSWWVNDTPPESVLFKSSCICSLILKSMNC